MVKSRKDRQGRSLRKGESQRTQDNRYIYTYTTPSGKRGYVYATSLQELRAKEEKLVRDQLDLQAQTSSAPQLLPCCGSRQINRSSQGARRPPGPWTVTR